MPSPLFTHVQKIYYEWHRSSLVINRQSGHQDIRTSIIVIIYAVADRLFSFSFSFLFFFSIFSFLFSSNFSPPWSPLTLELSCHWHWHFPCLCLCLLSFPLRYLHYHDVRHSTFNRYSIASRHIGQGIDVPCQSLYLQRWMNVKVKVKSEGIPLFLSFHPSFLLPESMYDVWCMDLLLHSKPKHSFFSVVVVCIVSLYLDSFFFSDFEYQRGMISRTSIV